jgi:glycosyltransferase involved in cell wall biosynthesis
VRVLRAHLPGHAHGFHDDHIPALRGLLGEYLQAHGIDDYWLWFYTPMAIPLAAELAPRGIIYDCMDELSAFKDAPRQLLQRENALLREADLVFTGGRSLYEAKRERHERVHCFPSSVDAAHFARAGRDPAAPHVDPAAQAGIGRPRLGFFGVVDERIDLGLLASLAHTHRDWQIVMVGPVVKIDPATLPRPGNIHWLGQQAYAELPDFVAGWDVCLLPFALNEATRFISPTKTLEYLAADRPAVSTPIKDVVDSYAHCVAIAGTTAEFAAACEQALNAGPAERERASAARAAVVAQTSWDRTVEAMAALIEERAAARQGAGTGARAAAASADWTQGCRAREA